MWDELARCDIAGAAGTAAAQLRPSNFIELMARLQEHLKRSGSKPARRGEAAVGIGVIDIFEPLDKSGRDPPGQCGQRVGEGVRARPANALE